MVMRRWSIPAGQWKGVHVRVHLAFFFLLLFVWLTQSPNADPKVTLLRSIGFTLIVLAAVVTHERLGSQDTELLVRLWRTANPSIREFLLLHPREALANARAGDPEEPSDPRLTPRGQRLQRHLRILQGVVPRTLQLLRPSPAEEDLQILARDLDSTTSSLSRLVEALGSARPRAE